MFPLIAFTADTVSTLTGLSIRQLQRWDRTGFFSPSLADSERRRPHSRIYSFQDVVALRTIARLREQGASFSELKKVGEFFASNQSEAWTGRRFFVVGKRVFFTHDEAVIAARPLGQRVEQTVLDLEPVIEDLVERVQLLPNRHADEIGEITHDRLIMGGAPVIAGTRIPTATIAWFHDHGYSHDAILREFPRLERGDVEAAIAFEHRRRIERAPHAKAVA